MKPDVSHLPYPQIGDRVRVVQKKDYASGKLTEGVVKEILTSKQNHPRGTKVRLENGVVGRIQEFVDTPQDEEQKGNCANYFADPDALI